MLIAWGLLGVLALPWLANHIGLAGWLRRWRLDPIDTGSGAGVAVVVPARDEAADIGACIDAIVATDVGRVVVVDDHSTDGTGQVARRRDDERLRVVDAPEPPDGWAGKSWACHTGADGAAEPWLLFVDADVRLDPRAPRTLVAWADRDGLDLVSAFGTWEVVSLPERWLVPAFGWLVRGAVPMRAVHEGRVPFANGQVVLVRTAAYVRSGGHAASGGDVLDDVALARVVQAVGGRVGVRWAPWAFRLRPYTSLGEIVAGYRKNLYAGLGRRPALAVVAVFALLAAYVGPSAVVVAGVAAGDPLLAAAAAFVVGLQIALRARLERIDGRPPWIALLDPAAGVVIACTLALSAFGGPARWKGRAFARGRADPRP